MVGSSRQRVWLLAEKLKEQYGWNYEVVHSIQHRFFSLTSSRFRILVQIISKIRNTKYELLFIHKSLFPWDVVFLILAGGFFGKKRLIYDLDDAEWEHSYLKTLLLVKSAHKVFCGSHPILEWAQRHTPRAVLIPTVVDADLYKSFSVPHGEHAVATIGWVGVGRGHFLDGHFAMIKPALDELSKKKYRFRFVILGAQNYQPLKDYFKGVSYEVVFVDDLDWADSTAVPHAIQQYQFDIGVMPTSDTAFNRAKCAFKAIEYMACGVPTVASRVGEAAYLIEDGVNGFLADTTEEWVFALSTLFTDTHLRSRMGDFAKQTIHERYSYTSMVPKIVRSVESLSM